MHVICIIGLGLIALSASSTAAEQVWLSSLDLSPAIQDWGTPGIDRSVEGKPLSIAGVAYARGYGAHAPAELHLHLAGGSIRFTAEVGIDDEGGAIGHDGSVEFMVIGDGKTLWRSGRMRGGDAAKPIDVDVTGIKSLELRVTDGGDGSARDHADWAQAAFQVVGAKPMTVSAPQPTPRWTLGEGQTTRWTVTDGQRLPHEDFIEQGGRLAGQVVNYAVGVDGALTMKRSVVWPSLRIFPNNTHGSLIHHYGSEAEPAITVDGAPLGAITVTSVTLDGTLTVRGRAAKNLEVERISFPCTAQPATIERWRLRNTGNTAVTVVVAPLTRTDQVRGPYGDNAMDLALDAPSTTTLAPGKDVGFALVFSGRLATQPTLMLDAGAEETKRRAYVVGLLQALRLETPEPELDRAVAMAKIRVAESINATRGGLMLAPGGLAFYAATWCNDNVEYAGPFFPFLGDAAGNQASLDTYRGYMAYMKPDYHAIPSSIVAEGTDIWNGAGDRGDAAMYAYGCARFCLARGDRAIAEELWPAIAWCLEYCKRQTTPDGVIASKSDELEGRFPAGAANLSTATLCYGGLRSAADLGRALGKTAEADEYDQRAEVLARAIETFFGATVDGFATYRYYDGNDVLRSWICLPLCMGLMERRDATIAALFSPRLWTADGLATQAGKPVFWDRSTLYGLRGAFQAGDTAEALCYLLAFTHRRLLGEHVPYAVETGTKGSQLSSESGLYCRIFTEGLFGILPIGLDRFRCTPRLPEGWPRMALRSLRAFGREFDVVVERQGSAVTVAIVLAGREIMRSTVPASGSIEVKLP